MEDFFDQDKAKALVYLLAEGDNKNKMMISDDQLLVIRKNQKKLFVLENISILKTENKKMLLPLIFGGILTPFAFLSYFINLFHPWFHLVSVLCGMLLFYVGWVGKSALTIVFKNGDESNFYLPSISNNIQAFIHFVNTIQTEAGDSGLHNLLFFEVEKEFTDMLFGKGVKDQQLFPLYGFTYKQLQQMDKSIYANNLVTINPQNTGVEIKFVFDPDTNQMRPKLAGPVLEGSKVNMPEFR